MAFGELVRAHRLRLGLSQEDLATKAGVGVRSLRDVETGRVRPRHGTVRLLADALTLRGVDRERFLDAASGVDVAAGPPDTASPEPEWPRPAQLPHAVAGFVGREDVLAALDARAVTMAGGGPSPAVTLVVAGTAGVGKTALVVHWGHRVARRFPDGQLYANLRGFDPSGSVVSPAEALLGFLNALGVPPERTPTDLSARVGLYRSLLAGRRVLVVLDNARDADQVRPLLPGAPGCLVVVTSRDDLSGLVAVEGARPLTVDVLSADEARRLLAARLGPDRIAAQPAAPWLGRGAAPDAADPAKAVEEIIVRCGRLPLALAIVAARAAARPGLPLARLADELREAGLAALSIADSATDVRAVFGWSYQTLGEEAARLYRLLGLHPGPDLSLPAVASLAGADPPTVQAWLGVLTRAHLLTEPAPGRYTLHDLLRAHATELAVAVDDAADRHEAVLRLLDHYVHTGHTAALLLHPERDAPPLPPPREGVVRVEPSTANAAAAWFAAEHDTLLAAADRAADGFEAHARHLAWILAAAPVPAG